MPSIPGTQSCLASGTSQHHLNMSLCLDLFSLFLCLPSFLVGMCSCLCMISSRQINDRIIFIFSYWHFVCLKSAMFWRARTLSRQPVSSISARPTVPTISLSSLTVDIFRHRKESSSLQQDSIIHLLSSLYISISDSWWLEIVGARNIFVRIIHSRNMMHLILFYLKCYFIWMCESW